jgi:hypothetical protein
MSAAQSSPSSKSWSSKIVVLWSTALTPLSRQTKYDAFLRIVPDKYTDSWEHAFDSDGTIKSSFCTTDDRKFIDMRRIIRDHACNNTYAFSEYKELPSVSAAKLVSSTPVAASTAPTTEPKVGKATNKQQTVLVKARKRKPSPYMQEHWKREREERDRQRAANNREYNNRLDNDVEFAKEERERKARDREKSRARRQELKLKKEHEGEMIDLFGKAFGPWGQLQREYKAKVGCPYMPCGKLQFFSGSRILDHGDMFTDPIVGFPKQPLILGGMPLKCNWRYRNWYHSLPIHPEFVDKEDVERVLEGGSYDEFAPFRYIDRVPESSDSSSDSDTSDDYCDLDSDTTSDVDE